SSGVLTRCRLEFSGRIISRENDQVSNFDSLLVFVGHFSSPSLHTPLRSKREAVEPASHASLDAHDAPSRELPPCLWRQRDNRRRTGRFDYYRRVAAQ